MPAGGWPWYQARTAASESSAAGECSVEGSSRIKRPSPPCCVMSTATINAMTSAPPHPIDVKMMYLCVLDGIAQGARTPRLASANANSSAISAITRSVGR